jgi:hypothetical protein
MYSPNPEGFWRTPCEWPVTLLPHTWCELTWWHPLQWCNGSNELSVILFYSSLGIMICCTSFRWAQIDIQQEPSLIHQHKLPGKPPRGAATNWLLSGRMCKICLLHSGIISSWWHWWSLQIPESLAALVIVIFSGAVLAFSLACSQLTNFQTVVVSLVDERLHLDGS